MIATEPGIWLLTIKRGTVEGWSKHQLDIIAENGGHMVYNVRLGTQESSETIR